MDLDDVLGEAGDEPDDDVDECAMLLNIALEKTRERCGDEAMRQALERVKTGPHPDSPEDNGPEFSRGRLTGRVEDAISRTNQDPTCGDLTAEMVNVTAAASFLTEDFEPTEDEAALVEEAIDIIARKLVEGNCIDPGEEASIHDWKGWLVDGMQSGSESIVNEADDQIQRKMMDARIG